MSDADAPAQRLRLSLETVLESAHEAFVAMDDDGRILAWNREAERTFGWARDAVLGRLLRDTIIPERYRERHDEGLRRFLETGEGALLNRRIEITALHRNGQEFPVELTVSAVRNDGRWSFHAFLHDISDRYRASEVQARLATLVEHSADAIVSRTSDGIVTSWNPAAERLYGYAASEMIGRTVDRLVPPERQGEAAELIGRALRGEAIEGFETQRVRKDGRVVDVSITISPIVDDAGRVSELSMIARDVGQRKEAERALARVYDELERASELKSQFVAIASHELRTPLTSINGFATTMLEHWERLGDDEKQRFLRTIEAQGRRLGRLVDELLLLSSLEAGKIVVTPKPVRLAAVVEDVVAELGLAGETHVAGELETVADVDPDHLHHILLNYLANARRYGAPPYEVAVGSRGLDAVVRVRDHGEGVPAGFVPHLFESFTRASGGRHGSDGTGLGLAIVKGLAEASGGEVWYEPAEPRGACFCLRLRRARG